MDSDLDEELLGIAEDKPGRADRPSKKRSASSSSITKQDAKRKRAEIDPDETEDEDLGGLSGPISRARTESSAPQGGDDDDEQEGEEEDGDEEDGDEDMDLDIESEDGYDPSTRPPVRPHPTASSSQQDKAGESTSRPAIKRGSSSKEKVKPEPKRPKEKARPKPKPKKASVPKKSAARPKAKDKKSSNGPLALYPLEGKYKDAEDRDYLDQLPEIEREQILAARLEEQQRELDRQALGDLYKQTVGKDAESDDDAEGEEDMDIDEDSEDEQPAKKIQEVSEEEEEPRRKLGKKDVTSSAINALKERRQAKTERSTNKSDRPAPGRHLDTDSDSNGPSSEEGSVTRKHRRSRREYDDDDDDEYDEGGYVGKSRSRKHDEESEEKVELPVTPEDLNGVRLSRWELADMKHRSFFKDMVVGAFVKCSAGLDAHQQLKYRVFEVVGVEPQGATYRIEYKGKEVPENRKLLLRYGNVNKAYKMSDVSNKDFDHREFLRWQMTTKADKVEMPRKSRLRAKHNQLKELRDTPITEPEIRARLDALQGLGHLSATSAALQRQRLFSELELAKRSDDQSWVDRAQHDLDAFEESLGATSSSSWRDSVNNGSDQGVNALLAKVNEKNKREAQETAKRAHRADQARRKLADQIGMLDPSARVKMKMNKHDAGVPGLLAKTLQGLEDKKRNQTTGQTAPQDPTAPIVIIDQETTKQGKHVTQMRKLDAAVANAVDFDLGDF